MAVSLPFFMSEQDVIGQAKERCASTPPRSNLDSDSQLKEKALAVPPDNNKTVIIALNKNGDLISQVQRRVTATWVNDTKFLQVTNNSSTDN